MGEREVVASLRQEVSDGLFLFPEPVHFHREGGPCLGISLRLIEETAMGEEGIECNRPCFNLNEGRILRGP